MEAKNIDWDTIVNLLPDGEGEEADEQRKEMWYLFNVNENKGLTIFELEKGVVQMTQTEDIFDSEQAINDAFANAQKAKLTKLEGMEDKLDQKQFALFIRTLKLIYEFYQAVNWVDSECNHAITKSEFCSEEVQQVLEKWLGKEATSPEEFDGIDLTNKLGADKVLFKEFLEWALNKNLLFQGDCGVNED